MIKDFFFFSGSCRGIVTLNDFVINKDSIITVYTYVTCCVEKTIVFRVEPVVHVVRILIADISIQTADLTFSDLFFG